MKAPNCEQCFWKYHCEPIVKAGGFRLWGCLLRFRHNGHKPKFLGSALMREAKVFVPEYHFHWSCGQLSCDASYGDYIWHYAVEMKQEQLWNHREFREGRRFGRKGIEPYRSANPYIEWSRRSSWDKGYILGNYEYDQKHKPASS